MSVREIRKAYINSRYGRMSEQGIRGHRADLIIIDEGSCIIDKINEIYFSELINGEAYFKLPKDYDHTFEETVRKCKTELRGIDEIDISC